MTDSTTERPDQHDQQRLIVLIVASGAVLLTTWLWLIPWIERTAVTSQCHTWLGINTFAIFLVAVLGAITLPLAGVCLYGFLLCRRAVSEQRFPPSGRYFIAPRRIREGQEAGRHGYIGMLVSGLIVPLCLIIAVTGLVPLIQQSANQPVNAAECKLILNPDLR